MSDTYRERDKDLIRLGFPTYGHYLRSGLWALIRRVIYRRDRFRCCVPRCRNKGPLEAHHVSYSIATLLGLNPGGIVTLCEKHHRLVEFQRNGKKRTLEDVQKATISLLTNKRKLSTYNWLAERRKFQKPLSNLLYRLVQKTDEYAKVVVAVVQVGSNYRVTLHRKSNDGRKT